MKTKLAGLIFCILVLGISLCGCTRDKFPTGSFRHELVPDLVFEINKDGTWAYMIVSKVVSSGTYLVLENAFIVETDTVSDAIDADFATYEWSYQAFILTLKLKGDGTPPRTVLQYRKLSPGKVSCPLEHSGYLRMKNLN